MMGEVEKICRQNGRRVPDFPIIWGESWPRLQRQSHFGQFHHQISQESANRRLLPSMAADLFLGDDMTAWKTVRIGVPM